MTSTLLFLKVWTDNLTEHPDSGNAMDGDEEEQHSRTESLHLNIDFSETTPNGQNGEKTGDNEGNVSHQNADDYAMEEDMVTDYCQNQTALDERELLHNPSSIMKRQPILLQARMLQATG